MYRVPEHLERGENTKRPDHLDVESTLNELWAGLALRTSESDDTEIQIAISLHDGTYNVDFCISTVRFEQGGNLRDRQKTIEDYIVAEFKSYQTGHLSKILGVGLTVELDRAAPRLCSRLWAEIDIVPIVLRDTSYINTVDTDIDVDELTDSLARKCMSLFGSDKQPRLAISHHNEVQVDISGNARFATLEDYEKTVRSPTWRTVTKYARQIKEKNIRFAFFSATSQGGGVALMRHALLRFLRQFGIRVEWYVPRPQSDVFRITKTNHNILQGVVSPDVTVSKEDFQKIGNWIQVNAQKRWLGQNGPLLPTSEGGADVIIVDDPQMPEVIKIAKEYDPDRPVIFRSHIEVRDDLVDQEGNAAQFLWKSMWDNIKNADLFIAHPVKSFVPQDVSKSILGWLPATTDWLDGLNKDMEEFELQYYMHILRQDCHAQGTSSLAYPDRPFIAQVARFDPSKGIPDVVTSYGKLMKMMKDSSEDKRPQLIICGHASVDDPDGTEIYNQTMELIEEDFPNLKQDIVVMRLGPSDQMLNAILSLSKVVLQLSTREGFEVKVSEALHKGKPVIATKVGGIPLQIQDGKSGFLVDRSDSEAIAARLFDLFTDDNLYKTMSDFARHNVSDEVHTVGNAISWLWMVKTLVERRGQEQLKTNGRWINDLAREEANEPYEDGEPQLPRNLST